MEKKNVVVFGATGHLGAPIALHLKELGYQVYAVGHRKNDNGFFADYEIPYFSVDISNKEDFEQLPQSDIYAVVHFAGVLPSYMKSFDDASLFVNSVIMGTLNVLEYARKTGADRFVFPQSLFDVSYLFGTKVPIPADSQRRVPAGDHACYVITKNAAVDLVEHYYNYYGIKRFILRLSRVYMYHPDPYIYRDGEKRMVADRDWIYKAMRGEDLEVWGDPNKIIETCSLKDFLQIVEKTLTAQVDGGIYNIGSGGSIFGERMKAIAEVFNPEGKKSKILYYPEKPSTRQFVLDIQKTVAELGYEPKCLWKDYLIDFKKEMEAQRFAKLWGYESDYLNQK
ncbi:MAG: NAD(P)-dependent oxidoreductase [Bacteroidales bacterium]|nr:NAD(P)-dependent oxidoreductase [Bacteroidales bacterium]